MMRFSISGLGAAILGVIAFGPTSLAAQAVTKSDIAGAWRSVYYVDSEPGEFFVVVRADGTWRSTRRASRTMWYPWSPVQNAFSDTTGHWALAGDTLWFADSGKSRVTRGGQWQSNAPYIVALQQSQLALTLLKDTSASTVRSSMPPKWAPDSCTKRWMTFTKFDTLHLPEPPLRVLPVTLKRVDLVGTWVTTRPDGELDTLTLNPDSTWLQRRFTKDKNQRYDIQKFGGTWAIQPGDKLLLIDRTLAGTAEQMTLEDLRKLGSTQKLQGAEQWKTKDEALVALGLQTTYDNSKVTLHGDQLLFDRGCGDQPLAYQRVKP